MELPLVSFMAARWNRQHIMTSKGRMLADPNIPSRFNTCYNYMGFPLRTDCTKKSYCSTTVRTTLQRDIPIGLCCCVAFGEFGRFFGPSHALPRIVPPSQSGLEG